MSDELVTRVAGVIARTQKIPSLDGINILFALEREFNIDIPDEAVREMTEGVEKLLAAKAS